MIGLHELMGLISGLPIINGSSRIFVKRFCHQVEVIPSEARNLVVMPSKSGFLGFRLGMTESVFHINPR
jgi:hypothetical protein